MSLLAWLRPPRHLLVLFLVVTLAPAAGLIWLGWRLLQQDRALMEQRIQEHRERAADPALRLLYYPVVPPCQNAPASLFRAGEDREFRLGDYAAARPGQGDLFRLCRPECGGLAGRPLGGFFVD